MGALILAAMLSAQSADIATTCKALGSGRFVEANSLLPSGCVGIAAVKGLSLAGGMGLVHALRARNHRTAARVVAIAWIATAGTAATLNARKLAR